MAFDFPANPVLNDIYTAPDGTISYYWNGYAWLIGTTSDAGATEFVRKVGDNMTGHLTLSDDPEGPLHAATKNYVDTRLSQLTSLIANKGT